MTATGSTRVVVPRSVLVALLATGVLIVAWLIAAVVPLAFPGDGPRPWTPAAWWYAVFPVALLIPTLRLAWWGRHRRTGQAFAGVFGGIQLAGVLVSQRVEAKLPFDPGWPHDLAIAVWLGLAAIVVGQLFAFWAERRAADAARDLRTTGTERP